MAAVLQRGEVEGAQGREPGGVGGRFPVHAQARDAAVGVLLEPQVRDAPPGGDGEAVGGVPADGRARDERGPGDVVREQLLGGRGAGQLGALDGHVLGVVAAEVGGVDDDAADDARHAQSDQRPVVVPGRRVRGVGGGAAAPAGLPAVHDLALVAEEIGVEAGGFGGEQVLALGEELVVGGDHGGAEPSVREVGQVGEGKVGAAVVGVRVAAGVRARAPGEGKGTGRCGYGAVAHVRSRSRPVGPVSGVPWSAILRPRSQVDRTTPCSRRPA